MEFHNQTELLKGKLVGRTERRRDVAVGLSSETSLPKATRHYSRRILDSLPSSTYKRAQRPRCVAALSGAGPSPAAGARERGRTAPPPPARRRSSPLARRRPPAARPPPQQPPRSLPAAGSPLPAPPARWRARRCHGRRVPRRPPAGGRLPPWGRASGAAAACPE